MAQEFDSGNCFDSERRMSELSEVASAKPILEEQHHSDPPSPDHKASKMDPSAEKEIRSENTQMMNVNFESPKESETNLDIEQTNSGGNVKNRELGFQGGKSPKQSESNLEIEETNSGGNFKHCKFGFAGGESRKGSELKSENEETDSGGNLKNCELGFAGGESPKDSEAKLETEKTNFGGNFNNCQVGFAGGEKAKKWKKVNFEPPKESEHNAETQNTNLRGNVKKCEVGFSGGEKTKKGKKVNFQSHKESEHNAETQNTNFAGNFKNCEVGFSGGEKTKKWKKVVKFERPNESESNAETENTNFAGSELGFAGGEKAKKWKKVVKFDPPKESKSNLENEVASFGGNFKNCQLGFSGGERTKKSSVSKFPLQEVRKHPVSDEWNTNFDTCGVTSSGAAKSFEKVEFFAQPALGSRFGAMTHVPQSNHFNTSRFMGDSYERFDKMLEVMAIRNLGILPMNVGVPLRNVDNLRGNGASEKCALKIAVVDDTALIETCVCKPGNGVRKENGFVGSSKPHKKRTITIRKNVITNGDTDGKNQKGNQWLGNGANGREMNLTESRRGKAESGKSKVAAAVQSGFKEKAEEAKRSYSRQEMEALRFKNLDQQRKKWIEARSGFSPNVATEYDSLVDCGVQMQISSNIVPQQQIWSNSATNVGTRGILGAGAAVGNQAKLFVH